MMYGKVHRSLLALALTLAALPAWPLPASAAESFAGKTVTVYSPSSPGGGYDLVARLIARHIPKYLPGQPVTVVKNMLGAGGVRLATHLYSSAARDGTEFGVLQGTNLFLQLSSPRELPYDTRKFGYLGAMEKFVPILVERLGGPLKTFDDARKTTMSFGSSGPGDATDYFPRTLNAFFGTKFKIVRGYKGAVEVILAMERGEVDAISWSYDTLKAQRPEYATNNSANVLIQLSYEGDPELNAKGVPRLQDIIHTPEQEQIAQLAFSGASIARPLVTPPGLPPERLATLREAFNATIKDPDFVSDAIKSGFNFDISSPERMEEVISRAYATDPTLVAKFRAAMAE